MTLTVGPPGDADPQRLGTLLDLLGRPQEAAPLVLVGGGPGKTSVVRMLTALLGAFGVKVGSYSAPHLQEVNERIRIASEPVTADELDQLERYLEPFLAETSTRFGTPLTPDETLLAAALTAFADAPVDAAVVEVTQDAAPGVLQTDLLVVPSLPRDLSMLVRQLLRREGTLVVCDDVAQLDPATRAHAGAVLQLGKQFDAGVQALAVGGKQISLHGPNYDLAGLYLPVHGPHQVRNASGAMAAAATFLAGFETLDAELVGAGLASARLPGRVEVVRRADAATVVLDAAVSAHSVGCLYATLGFEFGFRHQMLVAAPPVGADEALAAELAALADHVVLLGDDDGETARLLCALGVSVEHAPDVTAALEAAEGLTVQPDGIVVVGPDEVLGAVRTELGLPPA